MLSVQIFTDSLQSQMLADLTPRIHAATGGGGLRFSTNRHGFAALELPRVPMSLAQAFEVYEWPGIPHVVVSDGGAGVVWEGRLEDISIIEGGVRLGAFGYQRAFYDVPYSALWSKSGTADWKPVTTGNYANAQTQQYETDNNNRLYIAPRKGETIRSGNNDWGMLTYAVPHLSDRTITNISFDYSINLTSAWRVLILTFDDDFANAFIDYTHTADGTTQTGTITETLTTPNVRIAIAVQNNTGSSETISGDTGDRYARLTNIRIKTTTASTVLASNIVTELVDFVDTINTYQSSGTNGAAVSATATDLQDELYEDEYPAAILDRLALLHTYEWCVWEGRRLHFQEKGSAGRAWFVDVTRIIDLQRSLENVYNSAYSIYRDADDRAKRTADADDTDSQARYGVVRRGFVSVQTTSSTEAGTHRDAWLSDRANQQTRANIEFDRLYDASGAEWPLYSMRSGDTLTMRNLPPTLAAGVDRIRTFVIGETEYDAEAGTISITPEEPLPSLERLVARRAAVVS